ncbi:uncharacterized protein LY89DRAFT_732105 [Mollisia scopiformis]|uniref:Uncharacterized protein n=1 Tax=Mollisia scopiformis TaxID=149040 RepID=A0A194XED2_MOLSC|nr:uncharacterized protein LY89DRAFT_732105 [Mollisia scopiformis]KUJ18545.1 hypothetical protein LY89DRAFT_732105 [Mollisia scopiformis]
MATPETPPVTSCAVPGIDQSVSQEIPGTIENLTMKSEIGIPAGDVECKKRNFIRRIPYNNGYGNFVFHRWLEDPVDCVRPNFNLWRDGSYGNSVKELDGFERSGSFAFFKLPDLIRKMVFLLLLRPLFEYDKDSEKSFVQFIFGESSAWVGNELMLLTKKATPKPYWAGWRMGIDWHFLESIRQASNVNTTFRKELADTLWSRTGIATYGNNSWLAIPEILQQRPSICAGIKYLYIGLDLSRERNTDSFEDWCESLSQRLILERLTVKVLMEKEDIPRVLSEWFPNLAAAETLNVTQSFTVSVSIRLGGEKPGQILDESGSGINEQYRKELVELMMPKSLRPKVFLSATETYLESRHHITSNNPPTMSSAPCIFCVEIQEPFPGIDSFDKIFLLRATYLERAKEHKGT